ncbi:6-phosphogluconolactonase [Corynebacterium phocae]|uniref:6-phosphogluconolactonase n=1 Tax=Corynebacterium phocae TaxID=161895 RepID=A0A1L7D335_9CORY|nr:6-phosphogluconolactonase [Corynebacterium phocae]APT92487.1 6-phosphogluconolactonase [Corynebacterium phocae]KAA8725090.1 6-phosphogluconolactonase [Corynebacterium phocae]
MVTVTRVRDVEQLCTLAALDMIELIATLQGPGGGLHGDGIARVVLTGGGAGIGTLEQLAHFDRCAAAQEDSFPALRIDWSRVHVFFGDERNVPTDHPESNEGQAREALLEHVNIPEGHIHGFGLGHGISMDEAAESYAAALDRWAPKGFDLHLLGMGGEGHINSLFPHTKAVKETKDKVLAVRDSPKPPAERVTLTLPAVNSASQVWFLVAGQEKAEAAGHILAGSDFLQWPAAGARGTAETVLYLADDAAGPAGGTPAANS